MPLRKVRPASVSRTPRVVRTNSAAPTTRSSRRIYWLKLGKAWVKAGRPILEEPYAGEIFAEIFKTGQQKGEITSDVDPERVGNLLRDAYLGTLYRWSRNPAERFPLQAELREIVRIISKGVIPQGSGEQRS
ncbi:hypothetical protein [Salinactinospora qingdaonensis]